jgi:hypothetical protein
MPARVEQAWYLRICSSPRPSETDACRSIADRWFAKRLQLRTATAPLTPGVGQGLVRARVAAWPARSLGAGGRGLRPPTGSCPSWAQLRTVPSSATATCARSPISLCGLAHDPVRRWLLANLRRCRRAGGRPCYCRAIAMRSRSSGSMKWSWSSVPTSS